MRDIATATLSGNLTRDVELQTLPSGTDVARLRVATTTRRRAGEEWVEKTNYFTVEVYGAQARSCAQYLRKGSRVFVDAELDWREWTDQQDHKREAVTFRARQVLFEGGRPTSAVTAADGGEQNGAEPAERQPTASRPASAHRAKRARRAPTTCRSRQPTSERERRRLEPAALPSALRSRRDPCACAIERAQARFIENRLTRRPA